MVRLRRQIANTGIERQQPQVKCDNCDQSFARPYNLRRHQAAVHGIGVLLACELRPRRRRPRGVVF